ncbi:MAG: hypothetical protein NTY01_06900 [Verrucomicrobia bacterium]|nr:hypothetical protein [Verrucomicrobiota bacterium]
MSMVFCDAFEHYNTNAQLLMKWTGCTDGITVGCQMKRAGASASMDVLFNEVDGAPALKFSITTLAALIVYRWSGSAWTQIANTGAATIPSTSWFTIAFAARYSASGSVGKIKVFANGGVLINATVQTKAAGSATTLGDFAIAGVANGGGYVDNVFAFNTFGFDSNGTFMTTLMSSLAPTGAGDLTQWTPHSGYANWETVAVANPTTPGSRYLSACLAGKTDLYTIGGGRAVTNYPFGVAVRWFASKSGVGAYSLLPVLKCPGVTPGIYTGEEQAPTASRIYYSRIWDANPAGTIGGLTYGGWTPSDIYALQVGLRLALPSSVPAGQRAFSIPSGVLVGSPAHTYSVRVTALAPIESLVSSSVSDCVAFTTALAGEAILEQVAIEVLFGFV